MEGDGLICNYKKCRKRLTDIAYVTACSHVFCDEDGTREFKKSMTCPACQTNLSNKFEIVRNNLQPSEQYKAMILAGMRPDMINDISSRALTFWEYQSHQEKTYLHFMVNKSKERSAQIEQNYEKFLSQTTAEINTSKKEAEDMKKKNNEITDRLMDRNRQLQKLQTMYDSLRRKFITASSFETHREYSPVPSFIHKALSPEHHTITGASGDNVYGPGFDFNPRLGCDEMVHHGDNTVQRKFSVGLSTPRQ